MKPTFLIAALACIVSPSAQAKLTAPETRMAAHVDANFESAVTLLQMLVNQNSGSLNLEGVERVGQMMRAELEPLGFSVVWKPMLQTKRAGHIFATHKGKASGKRMLLIGHLDTVFEKDSPFQTFTRSGNFATGPGVEDDKGGMVVMLMALKAMKAAGTLKAANIEIALTGDEEDSGDPIESARADLIAAGKRADIALDFEGLYTENGLDRGSIARRSSNSWKLMTTGKTGHSSQIFNTVFGDGAINEMARILAAFRKELPEPNLTFNTGLMAGGQEATLDSDGVRIGAKGKTNIIPATAIARGDFRTLSEDQTKRVKAKMTAIVAAHSPGTMAEIIFEPGGYPSMAPTDGNRAVLAKLNGVNRDLGLPEMEPLDPLKRGAGDISFVAQDVHGLIGLGASSTGAHTAGETIDLISMKRQAKRAAILMSRIAAEPR